MYTRKNNKKIDIINDDDDENDNYIVEATDVEPIHYGLAQPDQKNIDEKQNYKKIYPENVILDEKPVVATPIIKSRESYTVYKNDDKKSSNSFFSNKKIDIMDESIKYDLDIQKIINLVKGTCYEKETYTPLEIGCIEELKKEYPSPRDFNNELQKVCDRQKIIRISMYEFETKYPTTFTLWSFFSTEYIINEYFSHINDIFYDLNRARGTSFENSQPPEYVEEENNWWLRNMYEHEPPNGPVQYEWWRRTLTRKPLPAVFEMEKKMNKLFYKPEERSNAKIYGGKRRTRRNKSNKNRKHRVNKKNRRKTNKRK